MGWVLSMKLIYWRVYPCVQGMALYDFWGDTSTLVRGGSIDHDTLVTIRTMQSTTSFMYLNVLGSWLAWLPLSCIYFVLYSYEYNMREISLNWHVHIWFQSDWLWGDATPEKCHTLDTFKWQLYRFGRNETTANPYPINHSQPQLGSIVLLTRTKASCTISRDWYPGLSSIQ